MTSDLSGIGDTPYAAITTAVSAYLRKTNEEDGGACGRDILLLAEDDQHNPDLALERTKKLVEQDQVLAMIGGVDSITHAPVAPYLTDPNADTNPVDGVPDLFVSSGASTWGDVANRPWTIALAPSYATEATIQARYINQNHPGKKIGVLHQADDVGIEYLSALKATLADPALLVSEQSYNPNTDDLKTQLIALRDAVSEIVVLAVGVRPSAESIKISPGEGFNPLWLTSYVNTPSSLAREIGGGIDPAQLAAGFDLLKGSISNPYLLSAVDDSESTAILEHVRIMQAYDGPEPSTLSITGQTIAELIVETLTRACDNLTREGVLRAAESIRAFHPSLLLPGIEVNLGPTDHYAVQALQPVQLQPDGTAALLGPPISLE